MSKPPAKTAAAKTPASPATPPPAVEAAASKPATKPAAKTPLTTAAAPAAAKAAAAPKAAAKTAPKTTPKPAAAKTTLSAKAIDAKAPESAPKPEAKAATKVDVKTEIKAEPKLSAKAAAKSAAAKVAPQNIPPQSGTASPTNRFTDRFAPAPPVIKPLNDAADFYKTVKDPKLVNAWKTKAGRDMTEPELLSMPDSEYMNDKQLDFFRAALQKQKDDLLSNAGETTEHLREDTSIVPDPVDRATIEEEHALELRTRDRERKLLKKIAQSLTRVETGEYGFCDETGEPIGLPRLLARPTATLSLEAQQRRELKQKMFGD